MPTYAYRLLPPRAAFALTMSEGEKALMARHFARLQGLWMRGAIRFVGLAEAGDYAICVFDAADEAAAAEVARSDPAVAEGLMAVELHPFRVVFDGPVPSP